MVMYADRLPPAGDWRQGAAVAVLSFDVDAETPILAEGDHNAEDLSTMSHPRPTGRAWAFPGSSSSSPRARSRPPSSCRAPS
jgi:hypothetical protein